MWPLKASRFPTVKWAQHCPPRRTAAQCESHRCSVRVFPFCLSSSGKAKGNHYDSLSHLTHYDAYCVPRL